MQKKIDITIFTPTYNRANLLPLLFESLKKQIFKDFEWIIVDDGSIDNTLSTIDKILRENISTKDSFPIRYFKKENGGKHTAINKGVTEAKGELFLILDSDDSLPKNALSMIIEIYQNCKNKIDCGGVCGIMAHHNGNKIGSGLPREELYTSTLELRHRYNVIGDLLEVFKTSVMKEFPFPEFHGEKFCPEILVWNRIATKYKLLCFNKITYYRDYLEGGLTDKIIEIRMNSPIATIMTYAEMLDYSIPLKVKIKAAINYWRFRFCSDKKEIPYIKWFWFFLKPLGWLMHQRDLYKINSQG